MAIDSVDVRSESLSMCTDCGAIVASQYASRHRSSHSDVAALKREMKSLKRDGESLESKVRRL
jgi:hypothetical protein